jgi:RHS repeat-associated protein
VKAKAFIGLMLCIATIMYDGTTGTIYHADGLGSLGSTRAMSDSSQVVSESITYDAYGKAVATYGNVPNFGYVGQYRYYADATGLHYLKARYYDPVAGRFLSRDPIGYRGGLNLYGYVGSRPTTHVDPDGLKCRDAFNSPEVQMCLWKLSVCMANNPIKKAIDLARDGKVRIQICDDPEKDLGDDTNGDYGWRPWPIKDLIRLREGFECKSLLHEISHYRDGYWGKWFPGKSEDRAGDYATNKYYDNCCDDVKIGDFPPPRFIMAGG